MDCKNLINTIIVLVVVGITIGFAQQSISGYVSSTNQEPLAQVQVYNKKGGLLATSNALGVFSVPVPSEVITLVFYLDSYSILEQEINANTQNLNVVLNEIGGALTEVELTVRRKKVFALKRLNDVEETSIYAGKKTEVILVEESLANVATNNARQLYNQVAGLNIYETDDAGLQLSIGGRGLDPNRTANFNTRQNGYDISADVLGYPESYYTPAAEGLSEIQIIRGAASLQYGTQFGGLINFKMKEPNPNKKIELISRFTAGSNGLATNFTSLSGTANKFSYYTYYNYKQGDGFRDNSKFDSKNAFGYFAYAFSPNTKLSAELTYMDYLAQQAGGLTDTMFEEDPFQSNRSRNWFQVRWLMYNLKLAHQFSERTNATINFFGLNASRDALGYRTNRVSDADDVSAPRDLIKGKFRNFGLEARLVHRYSLFNKKNTFLIGTKYYNARNKDQQGPGTTASTANFDFDESLSGTYHSQSNFTYPNQNLAVFGENIFYVNDELSITPGFRFEYIKTETDGAYRNIRLNGAGIVTLDETIRDDRVFDRSFVLLGLGVSHKPLDVLEIYGNISQNYRSVTFSDIRINNPSYEVDPSITDEKGFTADIGVRGNFKKVVSYDVGVFGLFYNDRIGLIQRENDNFQVKNVRTNIGDAVMYGLESLIDVDVSKLLIKDNDYRLNVFANISVLDSYYVDDATKNVEFVPDLNIKTGIKLGYKDLLGAVQYSYLSQQFTDASNATGTDSVTGLLGPIPSYDVLDLSLSYTYKRFKLETGVNNVLDNHYFTRRATGYPGPGIIPSAPRNWFLTLQVKL